LKLSERSETLLHSPLFKIGGTPILTLDKEQKKSVTAIFQKMLAEQDSNYAYKDELIRNYVSLIIHEALESK
jgi:AraC family transcriptional regulator, transcriptional activator of pobA